MIHPATDEILERLWYAVENKARAHGVADLRGDGSSEAAQAALEELIGSGLVSRDDELHLTASGEEKARGIVRRHRLAEILFAEVLDVGLPDAEISACEIEHALSERVVDRVCAFLGHPPKCPHGHDIPPGSCCRVFSRKIDPLIMPIVELPVGGSGSVVFITPKSATRLNRLAALGIAPGTEIRLLKRKPSVVLACGQTSIAVEEEIGREIYVRTA
jgi:DtxR family transcriptional regulator, Mn-dependent transcriptional regulator